MFDSPNNFHFKTNPKTGAVERHAGLGPDEPTEKERVATAEADAELKRKEEALRAAERSVQEAADDLQKRAEEAQRLEEARQKDYDARIAALEELERKAAEREAAAKALEEAAANKKQ